ncbi:MAG: glycosyltransferase [Bacteroidales bacterium]|nr:glycosyltransferase [Bacteroidales bacterium]
MVLQKMIGDTGVQEWILLALFLMAFILQCGYYLFVYLRLPLYRPAKKRKSTKAVSVIICAKNEEVNLEKFLPLVLEQDHPEYEVVVVNDCSTDGTEELLILLSARYKHLRYTTIPSNGTFMHGKKLALTVGLKSARFNWVLLTDADCYPLSDQWLQTMVSNLSREKSIVLGYGGYERKKGLLNLLIRYETVFTAIQYLSYAIKGHPYMGVGRNLAYNKALFFENKGFATHYHIPSGDDDLLVNEIANGNNTTVEISKESHTLSLPKTRLRDWIKQKQRHLSAGNHYNPGSRIRIGGELISRLVLYSVFILLCIYSQWIWPVTALFGLLMVTRLVIFKLGMRRLDENFLLLPSLLLDPLLPLLLGIIWFSNIFVTRYQPWR